MTQGNRRSCTWLPGRNDSIVTVSPGAWWVAITRNPKGTRYRTLRDSGLKVPCQQKKGSDL